MSLPNAKREGCVEMAALQKLRSSVKGNDHLLRTHRGAAREISHLILGSSPYIPYSQTQSKAKEWAFGAVLNNSASPSSEQNGPRWRVDLEWVVAAVQYGCYKRDSCIDWDIPVIPTDTTELVSMSLKNTWLPSSGVQKRQTSYYSNI